MVKIIINFLENKIIKLVKKEEQDYIHGKYVTVRLHLNDEEIKQLETVNLDKHYEWRLAYNSLFIQYTI